MNIDEIIEESKNYWDVDDRCFRNVSTRDYVLFEEGGAVPNNWERIVAIFDEDALEDGETIPEAVARWGIESFNSYDYCLVGEFERHMKNYYGHHYYNYYE